MYRSNNIAWMTVALFTEWLLCIDADMKKANCKILMLVDNCTAIIFLTLKISKLIYYLPTPL